MIPSTARSSTSSTAPNASSDRRVRGEHVAHPIVRDDDQGINVLGKLGRSGIGDTRSLRSLEPNGLVTTAIVSAP